jgi:hypothetical protein
MVVLLFLSTAGPVRAVGGPTTTVPKGSSASMDGTLQSSEWSDATHLSFNWASSNSSLTSGGDLWLKNNGTNLMIAATASGRTNLGTTSNGYIYALILLFDDNNNGIVDNYDAEKITGYTPPPHGSGWYYADRHYNTSLGKYYPAQSPSGTGAGSFTNYGGPGTWYWEFSLPMSSTSPESFNLPVNGTMGFEVIFAEYYFLNFAAQIITGFSCWPAPCTGEPSGTNPSANGWANLVRSNSGLQPQPTAPPTPWYLSTWTFVGLALGVGAILSAVLIFARHKKHQSVPVQ